MMQGNTYHPVVSWGYRVMIEIVDGMAYSDTVVHNVLRSLIEEMGEEAVISQALIAERSKIPLTTVQYALRRLAITGRIQGRFTSGIGYRYRICDVQSN